jgi:hypothetical protein
MPATATGLGETLLKLLLFLCVRCETAQSGIADRERVAAADAVTRRAGKLFRDANPAVLLAFEAVLTSTVHLINAERVCVTVREDINCHRPIRAVPGVAIAVVHDDEEWNLLLWKGAHCLVVTIACDLAEDLDRETQSAGARDRSFITSQWHFRRRVEC